MSEFWKQPALIITPTLIAGTVILFLRSYISKNFAPDLAQLKSDLAHRDFETKEKFSGIYQKRHDIIYKLYGKLIITHRLIIELVSTIQSGGQNLTDKLTKVRNSFNDTSSNFDQKGLILPEQTAVKVHTFLETLMDEVIKFDFLQMGNKSYSKDDSEFKVDFCIIEEKKGLYTTGF